MLVNIEIIRAEMRREDEKSYIGTTVFVQKGKVHL